jgi:hypothetical protein
MSTPVIADGYCACGCGTRTTINWVSDPKHGRIYGTPNRFINGHRATGPAHHRWRTGRKKNHYGYVLLTDPMHPNADGDGRVFEHIAIVARALGRAVPRGAIVHHVDGVKTNNVSSNLVLCENRAYHNLIHRRERALLACGDPNATLCRRCHCYHLPGAH